MSPPLPPDRNQPLRWRDGIPAALVVVTVHAALIGAATSVFTVSTPMDSMTPPVITGVLVAEASQKLTVPASAPVHQPTPAIQAQPERRLPPIPAVQAPPSDTSINVSQEPEKEALKHETPAEETPPDVDRSPPSLIVPETPAQSETEAAPPVTPPMLDATYLQNPAPVYPYQSRYRREEGEVLLEVFIREDGSVGKVRVKRTSGHPSLDQSALDAVQRWRFLPARRGNEAIPYWYELPVEFSLKR